MSADFSPADEAFMRRALELARGGEALGEVPVGAVVVANGEIVAEGFNAPVSRHDPTAHAEILALRAAAAAQSNYRLEGATLYVTLEPCTMCVGALVHARVARVVFAATEPKAGSLVSARRQLESGYYNHVFAWQGGLLADDAGAMLSAFFRRRRAEQKAGAGNSTNGAGLPPTPFSAMESE
ncbi:MAG: cumB [Moraxellaceae bacterium]|jgi:tRNA(Arg) A34 adenosine deaminase TadA|nr:cumB [Moraxellaceae bacterium]